MRNPIKKGLPVFIAPSNGKTGERQNTPNTCLFLHHENFCDKQLILLTLGNNLNKIKESKQKPQMSCPVESDLNRHLEQLDIQAREEKHAENNPSYYWFITTPKWDEYAYSEDEKNKFIREAKEEGLTYSCTKLIEGMKY